MTKKTSRIVGIIMLAVAIAFFVFALGHPKAGFPWSNIVTYVIYAVYLIVAAILLIAPLKRK